MSVRELRGWAAALAIVLLGDVLLGCTGRKQVPFGLEDAGSPSVESEHEAAEPKAEEPGAGLLVGKRFEPGQVEVPIGDSTLVLQAGYALAALELDLDGKDPLDALVVSADPEEIRLQAAYPRGLSVVARDIDSFLVPTHCAEPVAQIRQLSPSLVAARVDHGCEGGRRVNLWLVTIEAQPRVRERVTALPPNDRSVAPIEVDLHVEDRDADGYEDVVADVRVGEAQVPLAWLNRPGGFARDASQPEGALADLANVAWKLRSSDPATAEKQALAVLDAFIALCRESGAARIGLSGTHGLQCQQSPATARAVSVAIAGAIRRGAFVRAFELTRWWEGTATQPTPEERELVQAAWRKARAIKGASWRSLGYESAPAALHFRDPDTLVIEGRASRAVQLSTGTSTPLSGAEILPAIRDPQSRFAVRTVRATCVGFEAEVGPLRGRQTHRVPIDRRPGTVPCETPIDRPASVFEWAVLGWAPQGLLAASGDMLRIVPLNELAKPTGSPIELSPGSPLPAPIRGARITPDGSRYVIPHAEGVVVRDWQEGGAGVWLRPADWSAVPGELRSVAISPDGRLVAVQKGSEIRLLTW